MKHVVACVQALWGTRAVGQEKEGELATTSLEFEYLHQKGRYKMLIGVDDTTNNVTTLGTFFFIVCLHSHSFPLRVDWRKSDSPVHGEPQWNSWWDSNSISILFQPCHQSVLVNLIAG